MSSARGCSDDAATHRALRRSRRCGIDSWSMDPLRHIVDAKIKEAQDDGVFDDLPGKGKPLEFTDDSRVPAELRGAYSVLRTAGMLPEEMELKTE